LNNNLINSIKKRLANGEPFFCGVAEVFKFAKRRGKSAVASRQLPVASRQLPVASRQ